MKIGMIVAVMDEMNRLLQHSGLTLATTQKNGYTIYQTDLYGHELFIAQSGAGEIGAAALTQLLITGFDVELIVNYGVVGGLKEEMKLCETVVVKDVVHYDYDTTLIDHCEVGRYLEFEDVAVATSQNYVRLALEAVPHLTAVRCASADKFVGDPHQKRHLHNLFQADICDMESAGIVLTCRRNQIDCLLIKAVSDSVNGGEEEFKEMVAHSAQICMDVLLGILKNLN